MDHMSKIQKMCKSLWKKASCKCSYCHVMKRNHKHRHLTTCKKAIEGMCHRLYI
uniref:Uncharacterized protein n=1 Tax=Anguilla anguilla TaxID=7936 RepID=A0A0E9UPV1_ANGAN